MKTNMHNVKKINGWVCILYVIKALNETSFIAI